MNTENLLKLATYLLSGELKATFSMHRYTEHILVKNQHEATECGTVGCAAGHGPYAGIIKYSSESWNDYVERVFGVGSWDTEYWAWLFSAGWVYTDNTPEGAAKRILYLIRHGLPDNWEEQKEGSAALCYLNEKL